MNPIGWRRNPSAPQADPALLDGFRELATSLISDNIARLSGTVGGLVPYHRPRPMGGTAVTVRTRPGDNFAIHRAFDFVRPGDVLVVDGAGETSQALMGDIMMSYAEKLGLAGVVIDGAIRDVAAIRARDFPVYARAVTHRGPYKNGPGEINVPVSVGGMIVNPGDIVVGDEDGVLAIAQDDAPALLAAARKKQAEEAESLRQVAEGRFDRSWVEAQERKLLSG